MDAAARHTVTTSKLGAEALQEMQRRYLLKLAMVLIGLVNRWRTATLMAAVLIIGLVCLFVIVYLLLHRQRKH